MDDFELIHGQGRVLDGKVLSNQKLSMTTAIQAGMTRFLFQARQSVGINLRTAFST
jgi:hypothetical protein